MKYGLVIFEQTDNIGDDIQAYAAMQFLPRVDYVVDREHLDIFRPQKNEVVAMIMNGWYMHNKFSWPPSSYIEPLYLSMHFSQYDHLGIGTRYLEGLGGTYLRRYAPIGCRDESTQAQLEALDIETYFSGCMTLTLPQQKRTPQKEPYICIADVSTNAEHCLRELAAQTGLKVIKTTHTVDYRSATPTWNDRVCAVETLLETYQNAVCVVTGRLHCALPCLAMQVPVLLLFDEKTGESDRLGTYAKKVHTISDEALIETRCSGYNLASPPENPQEYLSLREGLVKRCKGFISEVSAPDYKPRTDCAEFEQNWLERLVWQKELLNRCTDEVRDRQTEFHRAMEELTEGKNWLEGQYNTLTAEIERLRSELATKQVSEHSVAPAEVPHRKPSLFGRHDV